MVDFLAESPANELDKSDLQRKEAGAATEDEISLLHIYSS
jgi:hypothetical protein